MPKRLQHTSRASFALALVVEAVHLVVDHVADHVEAHVADHAVVPVEVVEVASSVSYLILTSRHGKLLNSFAEHWIDKIKS